MRRRSPGGPTDAVAVDNERRLEVVEDRDEAQGVVAEADRRRAAIEVDEQAVDRCAARQIPPYSCRSWLPSVADALREDLSSRTTRGRGIERRRIGNR